MELLFALLLLLANVLPRATLGQTQQGQTPLIEDNRGGGGSVLDFIRTYPELSEFAKVLSLDGLHRAFLERQVTIFAPNNDALLSFQGLRNENLVLNHLTNIALLADQFPERLTSLVTGNPPLWVSRHRNGLFINQAKVVKQDVRKRSPRGDEQILHIVDSVLEPLVPISVRDAEYFAQLDAFKLMTKSTLYDLSGHRTRVFSQQADTNQKTHMFGVAGQHTFFLPVDSAFDVGVQLSGYDYERNRLKANNQGRVTTNVHNLIRPDLLDARVLEGHIIPHRLLFTSHAPTAEFPTVAWLPNGLQVNVSLQPTSLQGTEDPTISRRRNYDVEVDDNNSYRPGVSYEDERSYRPDIAYRPDISRRKTGRGIERVVVRSNTIVGDRLHAKGMVVARIVRGNIAVQNGVVHLIDKPLMIVAKTLYEYLMEEGIQPGNRLSKFSKMLRDKGGLFAEAILEAKDGTLLAPSNTAFERADHERMDFLLGSDYLRAEMLGLHFVRERLVSTDFKIRQTGDATYSAPASMAANRVWFHYSPMTQLMTLEGRGINASVVEKDIGTVNGVIHVIDRVLGVPYQTVFEKLESDPNMSHFASLLRQLRLEQLFSTVSSRKFTLVVPSNAAWERAQESFSKAYNTLIEGTFPNYGKGIIERHFSVGDRPLTFEELIEMSRRSPRRVVPMVGGELRFTEQGEFDNLNAYKGHFISWGEVKGQVIRPNLECTNGVIHMVDIVFLDDAPPWAVGKGDKGRQQLSALVVAAVVIAFVFG